jgi:hypothetical protein
MDRVSEGLRDWNVALKKCLVGRNYGRFHAIKARIDELYQLRRRLTCLPPLITQELQAEFHDIRDRIDAVLNQGNRLTSRAESQDGCQLDSDVGVDSNDSRMNVVTAFRRHAQVAGSDWSSLLQFGSRQSSDRDARRKAGQLARDSPSPSPASASNYHILFDLKACVASICGRGETTELLFSLYNKTDGKFISEDFSVRLTFNGMPCDEDKIGKLYTIFADLSRRDLISEVYLLCRIVRVGRMILTDKDINNAVSMDDKNVAVFRRPFGFGVLDISDVVQGRQRDDSPDSEEFLMRIFTPTSENAFPLLFENIINKSGGTCIFCDMRFIR